MKFDFLILIFAALIDIVSFLFVYPAGLFLKLLRKIGFEYLPFCRKALKQIGVFPIRDHYYEPLFNEKHLKSPLTKKRKLPGIDWNIKEQLSLLDNFNFQDELDGISDSKTNDLTFYFNNKAFESGDAEYWYNIIRLKKPRKIIEIGSGFSTLMTIKAIKKNKEEETNYNCYHACIEPYEMPWLEKTNVTVIRDKVENIDVDLFSQLQQNDILFIDSSHIIRPQGDVLFEYLELLPTLNRGVIVHIHDIFSPRDYLSDWIKNKVLFWNEQYLLESFLTSNKEWKIIGALNCLHHNHYEKLKECCPYLTPNREPGSFYIQKRG